MLCKPTSDGPIKRPIPIRILLCCKGRQNSFMSVTGKLCCWGLVWRCVSTASRWLRAKCSACMLVTWKLCYWGLVWRCMSTASRWVRAKCGACMLVTWKLCYLGSNNGSKMWCLQGLGRRSYREAYSMPRGWWKWCIKILVCKIPMVRRHRIFNLYKNYLYSM